MTGPIVSPPGAARRIAEGELAGTDTQPDAAPATGVNDPQDAVRQPAGLQAVEPSPATPERAGAHSVRARSPQGGGVNSGAAQR